MKRIKLIKKAERMDTRPQGQLVGVPDFQDAS